MLGTSRVEFYFIRACILGLRLLTPLCFTYTILSISNYARGTSVHRLPLAIEILAYSEVLFYLFVYVPRRIQLQREAVHPAPRSRLERKELFALCNSEIPALEDYLQKWFLGARLDDIKRDNVKEFFLWAFFDRGGAPGSDDEELEEYIEITEKRLGRRFEAGRGSAKSLRLTLDKVDMQHRSLTWYLIVGIVDFLTFNGMYLSGFRFYRLPMSQFFNLFPLRPVTLLSRHQSPAKHLTYWYRPHTSRTKTPIIFVHGIGIGLYPYLSFFNELNSTSGVESNDPNDQVGIIALEIMPIAFRITHEAIRKEEMCAEITAILNKHFPLNQKFTLISHSYGSVITTHILKTPSLAPRIGPVVLVDPVTILLHLPDVAYNFTRRKPKFANEHQLHYFASMDVGVSHTLSRHFFWSENILWKEDMKGRKVTVCLGERDLIVNTIEVGRYLTNGSNSANGHPIEIGKEIANTSKRMNGRTAKLESEEDEEWKYLPWKGDGIDVLWFPDLDHAQVFEKFSSRKRVIAAIKAYCEDGVSE